MTSESKRNVKWFGIPTFLSEQCEHISRVKRISSRISSDIRLQLQALVDHVSCVITTVAHIIRDTIPNGVNQLERIISRGLFNISNNNYILKNNAMFEYLCECLIVRIMQRANAIVHTDPQIFMRFSTWHDVCPWDIYLTANFPHPHGT